MESNEKANRDVLSELKILFWMLMEEQRTKKVIRNHLEIQTVIIKLVFTLGTDLSTHVNCTHYKGTFRAVSVSRAVPETRNEWCVLELYYRLIEIQVKITLRNQFPHRNWNRELNTFDSIKCWWVHGPFPRHMVVVKISKALWGMKIFEKFKTLF